LSCAIRTISRDCSAAPTGRKSTRRRSWGGLATVAAALNANDLLLARIAAVHLRIPDLPDRAARERMEAEDRLIKFAHRERAAKIGDSEWNPALHPRAGTPPNPGWFASTDSGSSEDSSRTRVAENNSSTQQSDASPEPRDDRVKLPPSDDDIDELHDLVEWIASARPEDEAAIRAEIKKRFYDVGDTGGGNARHFSEVQHGCPGQARA
jgi:hypothetical protein